jgi:hypothetical protein
MSESRGCAVTRDGYANGHRSDPAPLRILSFSPVVVNEKGDITTKAEYARRYAAARRQAARMDIASRGKLAEVYLKAADQAARVVRDAFARGLSSLTVERWAALERKLKAAADAVARGTETVAHALIAEAAPLFPEIDADFVAAAARRAGAAGKITRKGLDRIAAGIETDVVASLTSRLWADGSTFSERVWGGTGVRGDWLERIKMTVAAGIAQGRDPAKIARDIQVYTRDGKIALVKRWGGLERGTPEFSKRLPKNLDWRAVRLVRTELYSSLRDASAMAGEANPGCDGLYDWVLSAGRQHWACECDSLAAGSPYKYEDLPSTPHPNCFCDIRPHLRDMAEFTADLARWARGESVDYIDRW